MRRLLITAALLSGAILLTGCTAGSAADSEAPQSGGAPGDSSYQYGSIDGIPGPNEGVREDAGSKDGMDIAGPQIITTVQVTVTVDSPVKAADEAARITLASGGTVAYRVENEPSGKDLGSAQLTLRIPSAKLTETLEKLKDLGVARNTSINSTDVTQQSQDIDARIKALQTSVDRLLTLMEKATSTQDLITIESALSQRQSELESLETQKRYLDDQVALSTVSLYLISEQDTPKEQPDNFWTGLVAGWTSLVAFLSASLIVIGALLPWLALLGLIALIVVVWVRLALKRSKSKKTEANSQ
ncbi:MAG: DUF4349 domain-containing protein [Cryobacterium sp.]|nr:DUF4349 domain-containing protein [Cryobacterium sp.]